MVEIRDMVRQADELHGRANKETDPNIRDRLNRMAETYDHIAKTEAEGTPASIYGLMSVLTQREKKLPTVRGSRRFCHRLPVDNPSRHILLKLVTTRLRRLIYLSWRRNRHIR